MGAHQVVVVVVLVVVPNKVVGGWDAVQSFSVSPSLLLSVSPSLGLTH